MLSSSLCVVYVFSSEVVEVVGGNGNGGVVRMFVPMSSIKGGPGWP